MAPDESSTSRTVNAGAVPLKFAAGTKRISVLIESRIALAAEAPCSDCQSRPSNHSQAPCAAMAALPTTATPAKLFADEPPATVSSASENEALNTAVTVWPAGFVLSSLMAVSDWVVSATFGASFTGVTLWVRLTVPVLYGVVPPLVPTLAVAPSEKAVCVLSTRRTDSAVAGPLKFVAGRKRRNEAACTSTGLASEAVPTSLQVEPFVDHCHLPDALVPLETIATAASVALLSTSEKWMPRSDETVWPAGAESSLTAVSAWVVPPMTVGASLVPAMLTKIAWSSDRETEVGPLELFESTAWIV